MIAVAGAIAVHHWNSDDLDDVFWDCPEVMSDTDWQLSGCAPGKPDRKFYNAVDEVAVLLARDGPHWPELTLGARTLILESRRLVQGSRQDDQ
jgi:hypothetical protein